MQGKDRNVTVDKSCDNFDETRKDSIDSGSMYTGHEFTIEKIFGEILYNRTYKKIFVGILILHD